MKLWVGTAGYSYPDWVGRFYPHGTRADAMLPAYAAHFPAVEINSSFYRPPTPEQAAKMCKRVPAGFGFALKAPRSASHAYDDAELPAFRRAAEEAASHGKLLGLLVQVAESYRNVPANRDWLVRVREELSSFPVAVEFRHVSWDVPGLPRWAERHGFDVVSVGVPDLPELFPAGLRVVGPRVYCRLHSGNAAAWHAGGPARYDYDYPADVLRTWADGLSAAAGAGVERAVVVFNNCVGTQAVGNAKALTALLANRSGVEVVRPPTPTERTLFDEA